MNAPAPLGDVDTPRPLRAAFGHLTLRGWCLFPGQKEPPEVRLVGPAFALGTTERELRDDVARACPQEPAARESGFLISGRIPPGVHLAQLQAQRSDGHWTTLRTLCFAADATPFAAGIEAPVSAGVVADRVFVEGWALDICAPVAELSLRYGHQEIPADLGRSRPDLAADIPHAARAGFKSRTILSAGRGALRLKAKLDDGRIAIARTPLKIAIDTDENVGREIDLAGRRFDLATPAPAAAPPPPVAARPLNLLFVLYGSFDSNSALHVAALANELALAGHACSVAVPRERESLAHLRTPRFRALDFAEAARGVTFPDGRGPDIVHAWTTRENVRTLALALRERHRARLVVHLEDNEQQLLGLHLGRTPTELAALAPAELDRLVPADLAHPRHASEFLAGADGVTVIVDALREFVPTGPRTHLLTPGADEGFFAAQPPPEDFRRLLRRRPEETLLFYPGNVHAANAAEVRELYAAVARLNAAGQPVTLIRTGLDRLDFLGDLAPAVAPHVVALGQIRHHHHLPALMAVADIFVQPGWDDPFNHYRFPSKLPEFFALGRPVVLPRSNLGQLVQHGRDAFVVDRADTNGITAAVVALRADPALRARLGAGAAAFAREHFRWRRSAGALANFYAGLTG